MGLSLSILPSALKEILKNRIYGLTENVEKIVVKTISFDRKDRGVTLRTVSFKKGDSENALNSNGSDKITIEESISFMKGEPEKLKFETTVSFKNLVLNNENMRPATLESKDESGRIPKPEKLKFEKTVSFKNQFLNREMMEPVTLKSRRDDSGRIAKPMITLPEPAILFSPRPVSELDAAAVKLQKVYKSYRTRRNLADCAVVVEELWWKALDFAALKRSSVSFFDIKRPETAVSKWTRAKTRAAKVGKGLSKDEKAQKLALQHWLEAIDPRHRYGHNLHFYYDVWCASESTQPFFYWLDIGDGKELNLEKCPRIDLQRQCIKYLGPKEREAYEVIVENGKLVYKEDGTLVDTIEGSKWIFVLSTYRALYIGQKKKGAFQHSSFLAGGATTAAGRLVARNGVLEAIWPYSGHYHPTKENFKEFISFLQENHIDLANVKMCSIDDDNLSFKVSGEEPQPELTEERTPAGPSADTYTADVTEPTKETTHATHHKEDMDTVAATMERPVFNSGNRLSCKWATGAGPRIGCVRDYPTELQFRALEQVNLSPRVTPGPFGNSGPIPSPRPSPKVRLSPRLAYMGLPSPRVSIPAAS